METALDRVDRMIVEARAVKAVGVYGSGCGCSSLVRCAECLRDYCILHESPTCPHPMNGDETR